MTVPQFLTRIDAARTAVLAMDVQLAQFQSDNALTLALLPADLVSLIATARTDLGAIVQRLGAVTNAIAALRDL